MYFKPTLFLSCLTVSSFASQSSNSMTGQSYRKINFPLQIWNLISSSKSEEVTIAPNAQSRGIIECGVTCQIKSDCGGFLYDKTSGSCTMKSVKSILILYFNQTLYKLLSLFFTVYVSTELVDFLWCSVFCRRLCQNWKIGSMPGPW